MRRVRYLSLALSTILLLVAVGPAEAAAVDISLGGCATTGGGATTVPANTAFTIHAGWGAVTLRQEVRFLVSVKVNANIDGIPITAAYRYWRAPEDQGDLWAEYWKYRVGKLAPGETIHVHYKWTFEYPVYDGFDHFPAGTVMRMNCTITGVGA